MRAVKVASLLALATGVILVGKLLDAERAERISSLPASLPAVVDENGQTAGDRWLASLREEREPSAYRGRADAERLGGEYGRLLMLALTMHFQGTCGDTEADALAKAQVAALAAFNELGTDQTILLLSEAQLMNGFLDQLDCP